MSNQEKKKGRSRPLLKNLNGNGRYAHVVSWGTAIPERVMTNHEIEQTVDTTDEWITTRTGIKERRIAGEKENIITLGTQAARNALAKTNILPRDLDLIVVATSTPMNFFPSAASIVQDNLGATQAGAFDLLAACTGFIYGLGIAADRIKSGSINTAVIIGSETLSRVVSWEDRATCVLFGDGAGAFVLQASDKPGGIQDVILRSDGSGGDLLYTRSGMRHIWNGDQLTDEEQCLHMSGQDVFKFASRAMSSVTQEIVERNYLKMEDIDIVVPHQANLRIIDSAVRSLGLPKERFIVNIERYGNTSTASIPIAFEEGINDGRIQENSKIVLVAFGGGLTWGAALIDLATHPTAISELRGIMQDGWYIVARGRSMIRRFFRFIEALWLRIRNK